MCKNAATPNLKKCFRFLIFFGQLAEMISTWQALVFFQPKQFKLIEAAGRRILHSQFSFSQEFWMHLMGSSLVTAVRLYSCIVNLFLVIFYKFYQIGENRKNRLY